MTIGANWNGRRLALALVAIALVGAAIIGANRMFAQRATSSETSQASRAGSSRFVPSAEEWATLSVEPVTAQVFRTEHVTEGKIAVNEDSSTPIFSPYAGRVTKLLVKPSDVVERGQPLFIIEATDTVQALNDFITALSALEHRALQAQSCANRREASGRSVCGKGSSAEGLAAGADRSERRAERYARGGNRGRGNP